MGYHGSQQCECRMTCLLVTDATVLEILITAGVMWGLLILLLVSDPGMFRANRGNYPFSRLCPDGSSVRKILAGFCSFSSRCAYLLRTSFSVFTLRLKVV